MASKLAAPIFLIVVAIMAVTTIAHHDHDHNHDHDHDHDHNHDHDHDPTPKKFIVGGPENKWTFGFDYTKWATKNAPFYIKDILVFKYDAPSEKNTHPHSVYLLDDITKYRRCDLTNATLLANETQGTGDGFEFKLTKKKHYYFACGAGNGIHCNAGKMKFFVVPLKRDVVFH